MTQYVWDASSYDWGRDSNHVLDFQAARADGIAGITHKATEGTSFTDPYFARAMPLIKQVSFPVIGSYHVLWPSDTTQTDHWFNVVDAAAPWWRTHHVFTWQIDAEKFDNMPRRPNLAEIHACGARLEQLGVDPAAIVVYAPHWLYGDTLKGLRYKLWSSSYGGNPAQHYRDAYPGDHGPGWDPYGGKTPSLWQYGSRTTIGAQHTCDASAARVTSEADLQALFIGDDVPLTDAEIEKIAVAVRDVKFTDPLNPDPKTNQIPWNDFEQGHRRSLEKDIPATLAAAKAQVNALSAKIDTNEAEMNAKLAAILAAVNGIVVPPSAPGQPASGNYTFDPS